MKARTMKRRFLSVTTISIAAIAATVGPAAADGVANGIATNHNETLVRD